MAWEFFQLVARGLDLKEDGDTGNVAIEAIESLFGLRVPRRRQRWFARWWLCVSQSWHVCYNSSAADGIFAQVLT